MSDVWTTYLPIALVVVAIVYYGKIVNGGVLKGIEGMPKKERIIWLLLIAVGLIVFQCERQEQKNRDEVAAMTPAQRAAALERAESNDAKFACRQAVERTLKAPSTAKFPYYQEFSSSQITGDEYSVRGFVDAQNSFGAMIRTSFTCHMKKVGREWIALAVSNAP